MAHSFDVFDAAGTHACSCQSNGGLASNCSKMHCEIDIGATKSCIFIILIYFSIKPPEKQRNTGFSSTDVNFTIHFIIVLARPPLLRQEHAAASKTSKE
jgi:hypothetical protein